jgi:hypothetical protein
MIFAGIILFFIIIVVASSGIATMLVSLQSCKHETVHETMACHVRCEHCGEDLGFVGTWREDHPDQECGDQRW